MSEAEKIARIVETTADTMEVAGHVLEELQKRDGNEFVQEKPSVMEIVAVSSLIVNMSAAGMFQEKKSPDWVPSPQVLKMLLEQLKPFIENQVSIALSQARLRAVQKERPKDVPRAIPPPSEDF